MKKITKTEFSKWSQDFKKKLTEFMDSSFAHDNLSVEEQVMFPSLISHISWGVEKENPFAVFAFITFYEALPGHDLIKNNVYPDTDGLTLQYWLDRIKQRLKEHSEEGGYYNSSEPVDSLALKQGWKKVWELIKKGKHNTELKPYLSEESRNLITTTKIFFDSLQEVTKSTDDLSDIKETTALFKKYPFLMKDLVGRFEKAQQALLTNEQNKPNQDNPSPSPNPTKNPDDKPSSEKNLKNNNWPLVLGIAALGFFCFIFILFIIKIKSRRKRI